MTLQLLLEVHIWWTWSIFFFWQNWEAVTYSFLTFLIRIQVACWKAIRHCKREAVCACTYKCVHSLLLSLHYLLGIHHVLQPPWWVDMSGISVRSCISLRNNQFIERFFFPFGDTGVWTSGSAFVRQMLYCLSYVSSPFCSACFGDRVLPFFPSKSGLDHDPPILSFLRLLGW
jgi:hypothetical protein